MVRDESQPKAINIFVDYTSSPVHIGAGAQATHARWLGTMKPNAALPLIASGQLVTLIPRDGYHSFQCKPCTRVTLDGVRIFGYQFEGNRTNPRITPHETRGE